MRLLDGRRHYRATIVDEPTCIGIFDRTPSVIEPCSHLVVVPTCGD